MHLSGHRLSNAASAAPGAAFLDPAPEGLNGTAAAFAALGRRGLLCDYAFLAHDHSQHRRGWLLHWAGLRLPHDLPKQDWLAGRLGRHLWHHLHALGAAAGLVDGQRCVAA